VVYVVESGPLAERDAQKAFSVYGSNVWVSTKKFFLICECKFSKSR
jgi:hypothetical protein